MTEKERALLRKLAVAYAFIADIRRLSISRVDPILITKTQGIEADIELMRLHYPRDFQMYYTKIMKKVEESSGIIKKGSPPKPTKGVSAEDKSVQRKKKIHRPNRSK